MEWQAGDGDQGSTCGWCPLVRGLMLGSTANLQSWLHDGVEAGGSLAIVLVVPRPHNQGRLGGLGLALRGLPRMRKAFFTVAATATSLVCTIAKSAICQLSMAEGQSTKR